MVAIKFDRHGLVPVAVQDAATREVLMVAYMDREAVARTLASGDGWYWSRSRRTLWRKGATSGHTQRVREVRADCDGDALLLLVDQTGAACHTGERTCFYRPLTGDNADLEVQDRAAADAVLEDLFAVVRQRARELPDGSYTTTLLRAGRDRIAAKVLEEAAELTRAARAEPDRRVVEEAADLLYHTWVLLAERNVELQDVRAELERRRHGG